MPSGRLTPVPLSGTIEAMEPPRGPHVYHQEARQLTADLRTSDRGLWEAVRQHLAEAGYDHQRSAVGELFPEDVGDFGVLVASDRTTHTFMVGQEPIRGERGKYRWWVTHEEKTTARERSPYASPMFAAMTLLEAEEPTGVEPLDLLIESVAITTERFRGLAERRWNDWQAEGFWDVLYAFMRARSVDPMKSVALEWTISTALDVDFGLLGPDGRPYHFAGSIKTINGPISQVTTWDELDLSAARSIYGEHFDAGIELLRREGSTAT
jgi:hypothetical protein